MKKLLFLLIISGIATYSIAQDCACCTENHKAFDFWVGEWNVVDTNGNKVGENTIERLEDNCILMENWVGAKGSTGKSFNYYNRKDESWNQLWIDNKGNNLKLKGSPTEGKMILRDELQEGKKGKYYNKITWTKVSENEVIQLWEAFSEEDKLIATLFKGIYQRKNSK